MELKQFWQNEAERMFRFIFPIFLGGSKASMHNALDILESEIGVIFDRTFINEAAYSMAQTISLDLAIGITGTSKKLFQIYASEWIESGEPLSSLIDRLGPVFGKTRAEAIAITEVTRIYALANNEAWRETGFVDFVIIQTAEDDWVCPICEPKAGTEVSLSSPNDNYPPFHVRCRCWEIPKHNGKKRQRSDIRIRTIASKITEDGSGLRQGDGEHVA